MANTGRLKSTLLNGENLLDQWCIHKENHNLFDGQGDKSREKRGYEQRRKALIRHGNDI
jgi:hypothetical protein